MITDEYEVREDTSDQYRPFRVFNLTDSEYIKHHFPTPEQAQAWIDDVDARTPNLYLFNLLMDDNATPDRPLTTEEQATYDRQQAEWEARHPVQETPAVPESAPAQEEVLFILDTSRTIGEVIIDKDGNEYIAVEDAWYISPADAADIEEGFDVADRVGWHVNARLDSVSTRAIVEQINAGNAHLLHRDFTRYIQFADDGEMIPMSDLDYNSEIGLFQKSKFPEARRD